MSIVKNLALSTLDTIARSCQLKEVGSAAEPHKTLRSPMSPEPVGAARLFEGQQGERMVYIGMTVPMIHLDSHMVFCFTGPESVVPHFTVDAVHAGDHYAFHLDLIPRLDLAVNVAYMRCAYEALNAPHAQAKAIPGLSPAQLAPMQLAVMSPWMLAHRATETSMDAVGQVCGSYLDHWLALKKDGLREVSDKLGQDLAKRDLWHRSVLFSPEVDPVWRQVERLLGAPASEDLRSLLMAQTRV